MPGDRVRRAARRATTRVRNAFRLGLLGGVFAGLLAVVNVIQVGALMLNRLRVATSRTVSAINSKVLAAVWGWIQWCMEVRNGAPVTFSGDVLEIPPNIQRTLPMNQRDDLPPPPSAFVIANHLFFCDFVLEHAVAVRRNMLGHCRYFSKESHKRWPLFGWLIRLAGFVFLKRDWEQDKTLISSKIAEWISDRLPTWIVIYPEGTRQTPEKLAASQEFAKKRDLPVLDHVLLPRTKGFVHLVHKLRAEPSHFEYLLDFTVAAYHVPTKTINTVFPTGFDLFGSKLHERWRFHVHVDAFKLADLPITPSEDPMVDRDPLLEQWLRDRWVQKDRRLAQWTQEWPSVDKGTAFEIPWPWVPGSGLAARSRAGSNQFSNSTTPLVFGSPVR